MKIIYLKNCCFYRKESDGSISCALNKRICFSCPFYIRKIQGLDLAQHIGLILTVVAARRGLFFSMLALLLSIFTLALQIAHSFSNEFESLLVRFFQH